MAVNNIDKNEIDLNQIFHKIIEGKTIIIAVTLLTVIMATIVAKSRPILFQSSALIEIGSFYKEADEDSKKTLNQISPIESSESLIRALKIQFNYANNENINISQREANLIQVDTIKTIDQGTPLIKSVLEYILKRHGNVVENYNTQHINIQKTRIENIDASINFNQKLLNIEIESNKGLIIARFDEEIELTKKNISLLKRKILYINSSIIFNEKKLAKEIKSNNAIAIKDYALANHSEMLVSKSTNEPVLVFKNYIQQIFYKIISLKIF